GGCESRVAATRRGPRGQPQAARAAGATHTDEVAGAAAALNWDPSRGARMPAHFFRTLEAAVEVRAREELADPDERLGVKVGHAALGDAELPGDELKFLLPEVVTLDDLALPRR